MNPVSQPGATRGGSGATSPVASTLVEKPFRDAVDEAIGTTVRPAVESGTESNLNARIKR